MPEPNPRAPRVLVVDHHEWGVRSIETVLTPSGYEVFRAYTGNQALQLVPQVSPDAILLGLHLPDMDGVVLCRTIRDMTRGGPPRPILVFTSAPLSRQRRLACLRAGAWAILPPPFDQDDLLLRLETYSAAKLYADHAAENGLYDGECGCYNENGLTRRLGEMVAEAQREARAVACVAFEVSPKVDSEVSVDEAICAVSRRIRGGLRRSDLLGRLDSSTLVVAFPLDREEDGEVIRERLEREAKDALGKKIPEDTPPVHVGIRVSGIGDDASAAELLEEARRSPRS